MQSARRYQPFMPLRKTCVVAAGPGWNQPRTVTNVEKLEVL
jgi:hypothetical protein